MDFVPGGNGYLFYPNGIHEQPGKTLLLLPHGAHDDLQFRLLELIRIRMNLLTSLPETTVE